MFNAFVLLLFFGEQRRFNNMIQKHEDKGFIKKSLKRNTNINAIVTSFIL